MIIMQTYEDFMERAKENIAEYEKEKKVAKSTFEYLLIDMNRAMHNELSRASAQYGELHHSPHEAYAVILEEYSEAVEDGNEIAHNLKAYWDTVTHDDCGDIELQDIRKFALYMAAEAIQTAAMAEKALRGFERGKA